jgi:type IV pilus assembly protein PilQ
MFVSALETVGDTSVLANPKLLVVDRQRGEVLIGQRQGYKTTTVSQGISSETIEFLETGTRLVVRPYVCKDGNIRLELHPEESTGGLDASGLPQESTTTVTSNVVVRDGHTIVIGGLFREETGDTRKQIPLLGNLPHVGVLFRNTSDATDRKEIIVLITPHLIQQDPDEAISQQIRDDVERFRLGQRNGLRWWGRNRLASSCLQEARVAMAAGNHEKAMWYTDMSLSMNPTMEEGLRLKEQMTAKAYWSQQPQDSSIRFAIQRMIMAELGKPYRPVVYPGKPRDDAQIDPAVRAAMGMMPLIEESPPVFRSYKAKSIVKPAPKTTDQKGQATPPRTK